MMRISELGLAHFIIEKTRYNLFLTGKAGTGKTTFLKEIAKYTKKQYVILAPTGVAAVNAGAMTIHSFFQIEPAPYIQGITRLRPTELRNFSKEKLNLIQMLDLIIIDEISMVRADLLDCISDNLKLIREDSKAFGGVQMLMIGDLQQLPPVIKKEDEELLGNLYNSFYFFDSNVLRDTDYYTIDLKKVYRQSDAYFIDILNRVRKGNVTEHDLWKLNRRYVANFQPTKEQNYISLVSHNYKANAINQRELAKLSGSPIVYEANITGRFLEDSYPCAKQLKLKEGARVVFIKNDPDKRYINGSQGTVIALSEDYITVLLNDSGEEIDVEPASWENIRYKLNKKEKCVEAEVIGRFTQYPLKLAWAITIHKSQGLTFDRAIIDTRDAFSHGQTYVALSRCKSLDGIVLSEKINRNAVITDPIVTEYMQGVVIDTAELAKLVGYTSFENDDLWEDMVDIKVDSKILEALREWRTKLAKEQGVPPYIIMQDKVLELIASELPDSLESLGNINGIGNYKLEKYGKHILSIISHSKGSERAQAQKYIHIKAKTEPKVYESRGGTFEATYRLFKEGKTISEIALRRGLTEGTVEGHLVRYIESGDINVRILVPDDVIEKLMQYLQEHKNNQIFKKDIYEYFQEQISYRYIKFVYAYWNYETSAHQ